MAEIGPTQDVAEPVSEEAVDEDDLVLPQKLLPSPARRENNRVAPRTAYDTATTAVATVGVDRAYGTAASRPLMNLVPLVLVG